MWKKPCCFLPVALVSVSPLAEVDVWRGPLSPGVSSIGMTAEKCFGIGFHTRTLEKFICCRCTRHVFTHSHVSHIRTYEIYCNI